MGLRPLEDDHPRMLTFLARDSDVLDASDPPSQEGTREVNGNSMVRRWGGLATRPWRVSAARVRRLPGPARPRGCLVGVDPANWGAVPDSCASTPVRTRPNTRNGRSSDPPEPEITPQPSPKSARSRPAGATVSPEGSGLTCCLATRPLPVLGSFSPIPSTATENALECGATSSDSCRVPVSTRP